MSTIIESSSHGKPALWHLCIDPAQCEAHIYFEPRLIYSANHRRSIAELVSVLEMHLHDLARRAGAPAA